MFVNIENTIDLLVIKIEIKSIKISNTISLGSEPLLIKPKNLDKPKNIKNDNV